MAQKLKNTGREIAFPLTQPRPPHGSLTILYWNIWYHSTPAEIVAAIAKFNCDALFLFEADANSGLLEKVQEIGYGGLFTETNTFGHFPKIRGGVAFFTRLRTGYIRTVNTATGRRGLWRGGKESRRCYLEAKLCIPGHAPIVVGGTHASYNVPFIGKAGYGREINSLLREITKHKLRYIFGGDLNAKRNSRLLSSLNDGFKYLDSGSPWSWPVRRIIQCLPHQLLDHAIATHDLIEAKAEFMKDSSSDHLPLLVTVPLNKED